MKDKVERDQRAVVLRNLKQEIRISILIIANQLNKTRRKLTRKMMRMKMIIMKMSLKSYWIKMMRKMVQERIRNNKKIPKKEMIVMIMREMKKEKKEWMGKKMTILMKKKC